MLRSEFEHYIERIANSPIAAVDTEGYFEMDNKLLDVAETVGLSVAGPDYQVYFPMRHLAGDNLPGEWQNTVIKAVSDLPWMICHNLKHDYRALKKLGISINRGYCSMLMAHMIDENIPNKGLDYLSRMHGGEPKNRTKLMSDIIRLLGWAHVPVDMMSEYGSNDARITYDLWESLYPGFKSQGFDGELWQIEEEFSYLIADMESLGVRVDSSVATEELEIGEKRLAEITNELGFNVGSTKEMGNFLLTELGLPVVKKSPKTDKPSFDKFAMEIYDELLELRNDDRAKLILEYRGWSKTVTSNYRPYLERASSDGRIRCNYKLHGTKTCRLSCEHPNLQQIPRETPKKWNGKLKRSFIGAEGYTLWDGDYAQLEFRLAAAYAKETRLIEIFNDPSRDIFKEMAKDLGMSRQNTKTLNYTIQYGGGINRISQVFNVSNDAAKAIIKEYYIKYPGIRKMTNLADMRAKQQGYITYWSGRRRHFRNPEQEGHKAFNSACQGGAAEIMKRTMIKVKKSGLLDENCKMLLQVHDDIVMEIRDGMEDVYVPEFKRLMEAVDHPFGVKFKADVHKWGE